MEDQVDLRDRILTPRRMGHLAGQLEEAIAALDVRAMSEWQIRIPPDSRLPKIVRLLSEVAAEESFPECPSHRALIVQAARDAQEFAEISWVLPVDALKPLRPRLQEAVFGTLGETRHKAYQSQSELWTGAVLARSGVLTGVRIADEGKSPDFILKNGTREYAVEVKRPSSIPRARELVSKAARQLRNDRYHGSAIVVDLTDCLGTESSDLSGRGRPNLEHVEARIKRLMNPLRKKVFDDSSQRIRARYRHVFTLVTFIRAVWWNLDDLTQMHPLRHVLWIPFLKGGNPEQNRAAVWLAELIDRGIGETGHQELGGREITFDA